MEPKTTKKPSRKLVVFKRELPFYLMLIPGVTFLIIFSYLPMFGLVMAFQDFTPLRSFKNSPWVGLKNFRDMLALPTFWNVVGNTLSISIAKIILRLLVPLILALLLNLILLVLGCIMDADGADRFLPAVLPFLGCYGRRVAQPVPV